MSYLVRNRFSAAIRSHHNAKLGLKCHCANNPLNKKQIQCTISLHGHEQWRLLIMIIRIYGGKGFVIGDYASS